MKFLALSALLMLTACNHSRCQRGEHKNHQVTAYGYGTIKAVPDVAGWTIEVEFTRLDMAAAMTEAQKVVNEVLAVCAKSIPDSNDIRTERVYTRKQYEWQNNKSVFKGYIASQTIEIKLRDFSKTESLSDDLVKAGITSMNGPVFSHSKSDSLRSEANALAMMDAKKNAEKICLAVKLTCEDLVSAKASPSQEAGMPVPFQGFAKAEMTRMDASAGASVKPGTLTFSATVEATYQGE